MQYLLSTSGLEFRELFSSVSTFSWAQHASRREKNCTGFHSCKYCVCFKSWEKETSNEADSYNDVFYKLFSADSLQYVILYVPWEIYEHTSLRRVGKSLNNWPILHLMCWRRRERVGSSHRLLLPNLPDLGSAVNSTPINTNITRLVS